MKEVSVNLMAAASALHTGKRDVGCAPISDQTADELYAVLAAYPELKRTKALRRFVLGYGVEKWRAQYEKEGVDDPIWAACVQVGMITGLHDSAETDYASLRRFHRIYLEQHDDG